MGDRNQHEEASATQPVYRLSMSVDTYTGTYGEFLLTEARSWLRELRYLATPTPWIAKRTDRRSRDLNLHTAQEGKRLIEDAPYSEGDSAFVNYWDAVLIVALTQPAVIDMIDTVLKEAHEWHLRQQGSRRRPDANDLALARALLATKPPEAFNV